MKKIVIIFFLLNFPFLFSGCKTSDTIISILVPSGSTELGILHLHTNDKFDIQVIDGPQPLSAAFAGGSHDVIIAPVNLGALFYHQAITGGVPNKYFMLGGIGFGNFFIVTNNPSITDFHDLNNQDIVIFGEGAVSDVITSYILQESGITFSKTFVPSVTEARNRLINDPNLIVLLAEPALTITKLLPEFNDLTVFNLSEKYEILTNGIKLVQAGVFVHYRLNEYQIDFIVDAIVNNIYLINNDIIKTDEVANYLNLGLSGEQIKIITKNSNIIFKDGWHSKEAVETFLQIWLASNPNLPQILPNNDFYIAL